jgi:hypothetical protein
MLASGEDEQFDPAGFASLRSRKAADRTNVSAGPVNEEFASSAAHSQRLTLVSRFFSFLSGILDSFSLAFFYLSYSSLTHLLHTLWCRLTAEEQPANPHVEIMLRVRPVFLTSANRNCYNHDGGGNSSTGRAPDCGSDGCGFDSRFPPQNFPSPKASDR